MAATGDYRSKKKPADKGEVAKPTYSSSVDRVPAKEQEEHLIQESQWLRLIDLTVSIAAKWYQLGTQLKLQAGTLRQIKADNPNDSRACLSDALERWHRHNPKASWENIANALKMMDESRLAEKIQKEYCHEWQTKEHSSISTGFLDPLNEEGNYEGDHATTHAGVSVQDQITRLNQHHHPSKALHNSKNKMQKHPSQGGQTELLVIYNELKTAAHKWKEIGLQLKMGRNELKEIQHECHDTKECFQEMLNRWLCNSTNTSVENWRTICNALRESNESGLAKEVAQKHGLAPKITVHGQPESQNVSLGETVTFSCKVSASGDRNSYEWLHNGHRIVTESSSKMTIKKVTKDHRGDYRCLVKNVFGEEQSHPAKLEIGKPFRKDTLRQLLKKVGIKATDWPEIGRNLLGLNCLVDAFVGGIFEGVQEHPQEKAELSWNKIAQTLEGMEGCEAATHKAKENAGKKLNKNTVGEFFQEAGIKDPDLYRICKELGIKLKHPPAIHTEGQNDPKENWEKFSENKLDTQDKGTKDTSDAAAKVPQPLDAILFHKDITWERLAEVLGQINGLAAIKARENAEMEISQESVRDVFREASTIDWHKVVESFPSFNDSCLIQVLLLWHKGEDCKDPWIIWRKLAALIESMKDDDPRQVPEDGDPRQVPEDGISEQVKLQLGIGHKLRLLSGVGLDLNSVSMHKVLTEAGVEDWNGIAKGLKLDEGYINKMITIFKNLFRRKAPTDVVNEILKNWREPRSWEELARVVENISFEIAQKTRQLSESGGFPKVMGIYTPGLTKTNVPTEKTVTFTCDARGAAPLKYQWMCDDSVLNLGLATVSIKVRKSGNYNCRVENELGSDTSEQTLLTVGHPPNCKIVPENINIAVRNELALHCKGASGAGFECTWLHNGEKLPPEKYQGPDLMIMQVTEDDQGSYECRVVNPFGRDSAMVQVNVGYPPVITSTGIKGGKRMHYETGVEVIFYCEASGTHLKYTWLHNGKVRATEYEHWKELQVTATEDTEGKYECEVKNDFGEMKSAPIEIKVGGRPVIKAPPKKQGKVVPGGRVKLTCEATGKGPFKYVWMHKNQTLVKKNKYCLTIDQMTEAHEGEYRCRVTNAYGYAVSESVTLQLEITQEGLMKHFRDLPISHRWYMFGILLEVARPILDRISRGFAAHGIANYSLQEVIGSWLEETHNPTDTELTYAKPRSWVTVRAIVHKMGYEQLAQDLGDKPEIGAPIEAVVLGEMSTLKCKATGKPTLCYTWLFNDVVTYEANHPEFTIESMNESHQGEYKCRVSNDIGFSVSEPVTLTPGLQWETKTMVDKQIEEPPKYSSEDVSIMFDNLTESMEKILSNPDAEHDTTSWDTESDQAVSEIQSYLQLIRFDEDQIQKLNHISSVFKFLSQYWNYQRCHLLKKIVDQFNSENAREKMQTFLKQFKEFLEQFKKYQSTTTLGYFAPATEAEAPYAEPVVLAEELPENVNPAHATLEGTPPKPVKYPPFMKTFKIKLQSTWAMCTLRDAENLLDNLLPDTVSQEFVWFSRAYRAEENSVCLEYVISPSVFDVLHHEMEMKVESMLLSSMSIISVHIDGLEVKRKTTRLHTYAHEQEAKPLETQGQLIAVEYLKENMLAELKDQISTQASVIEALQQRVQECENQRETQGTHIDALQQQLQKGEEKLAKATDERKKDIGALHLKLKTDEDIQKTKWKDLTRSMKEEVKREVTQHVDHLETSIKQNEDKLKTLPEKIKVARRKDISDVEERVKTEVSKLKEQVKNASQSAEENEKRLTEMSSDTNRKLREKQLTEEKLRTSELNALQKYVEVQLQEYKHSVQEYKHSVQELKGQIAGMERQLGIEAKLQELKREMEELKLKQKET